MLRGILLRLSRRVCEGNDIKLYAFFTTVTGHCWGPSRPIKKEKICLAHKTVWRFLEILTEIQRNPARRLPPYLHLTTSYEVTIITEGNIPPSHKALQTFVIEFRNLRLDQRPLITSLRWIRQVEIFRIWFDVVALTVRACKGALCNEDTLH